MRWLFGKSACYRGLTNEAGPQIPYIDRRRSSSSTELVLTSTQVPQHTHLYIHHDFAASPHTLLMCNININPSSCGWLAKGCLLGVLGRYLYSTIFRSPWKSILNYGESNVNINSRRLWFYLCFLQGWELNPRKHCTTELHCHHIYLIHFLSYIASVFSP